MGLHDALFQRRRDDFRLVFNPFLGRVSHSRKYERPRIVAPQFD